MSAPGTKLTFDVSGTLRGDGRVTIGCQPFTMAELTNSAEEVTAARNTVTVRRAVGTVGEGDRVSFAGTGGRTFAERQVRGVARNLQVEEPQAARIAATSVDDPAPGSVLQATKGNKRHLFVLVEEDGELVAYRNRRNPDYIEEWQDKYSSEKGWVWSVLGSESAEAGAQAVNAQANPNPATLRWQEGDQVEWIDGRVPSTGPRTRDSQGRWWRQNGHRRTAGRRWNWTDDRYDRMIAAGKVRIITKGGVHFT
jgi:hypothetical protein